MPVNEGNTRRRQLKSGVYTIRCKSNGKIYVGSSKNVTNRFTIHKDHLRNNKHGNRSLQEDFNRYGEADFEFVKVLLCREDDLFIFEEAYMKKYNSLDESFGYNCFTAGKKGRSLVERTKKQISAKLKGIDPTAARLKSLESIRRKVINKATGEIYESVTEAADKNGVKKTTLTGWLLGVYPNKSNLEYFKG
jgi:group I intron endonuclease